MKINITIQDETVRKAVSFLEKVREEEIKADAEIMKDRIEAFGKLAPLVSLLFEYLNKKPELPDFDVDDAPAPSASPIPASFAKELRERHAALTNEQRAVLSDLLGVVPYAQLLGLLDLAGGNVE